MGADAAAIGQRQPAVSGVGGDVGFNECVGIEVSLGIGTRTDRRAVFQVERSVHLIAGGRIQRTDCDLFPARGEDQGSIGISGIFGNAQRVFDCFQVSVDVPVTASGIELVQLDSEHIARQVLDVQAPHTLGVEGFHVVDQQLFTGQRAWHGAHDQAFVFLEGVLQDVLMRRARVERQYVGPGYDGLEVVEKYVGIHLQLQRRLGIGPL